MDKIVPLVLSAFLPSGEFRQYCGDSLLFPQLLPQSQRVSDISGAACAGTALRAFARPTVRSAASRHPLQRVAEDRHHVVDLRALDDQRRRHREAVAAVAQHQAMIEAVDHDVIAARADGIRT